MKYGDYENVTRDAKAIYDIMARQGNTLIFECIAEKIGDAALKFKLDDPERMRLMRSNVAEFQDEILDRI